MNNPLILSKIESLTRCVARIEAKRPAGLDALESDHDLQDIISVNLERAVQLCVDVSAIVIAEKGIKTGNSMAESFIALEKAGVLAAVLSVKMQKAVGFRNISVHEYKSIDWKMVFDIIHNHMINFKEFVRAIMAI